MYDTSYVQSLAMGRSPLKPITARIVWRRESLPRFAMSSRRLRNWMYCTGSFGFASFQFAMLVAISAGMYGLVMGMPIGTWFASTAAP